MQGHSKQAPAVAALGGEVHAHAFKIVSCKAHALLRLGPVRKRGDNAFSIRPEILCVQRHAVFARFLRLAQVGYHGAQAFAPVLRAGKLDEQLYHKVRPVIQEIIFLQRAVAARLHGNLRILPRVVQAYGLVYNVAVAAHKAAVYAAVRRYEFGKAGGGDGVGHYRGARVLVQLYRRYHGNKPVAVQLPPVAEHRARAVNIRIEYNAQIGMGLLDTIYDICHCTLVLRIWRMVGEMPVRLGKKAARRVRAKG